MRSRKGSQKASIQTVRHGQKGFSLIEILVSLGILAAILLPFMSFISYRLAKERESDELIRAIEIAKTTMEEVRFLPEVRDSEAVIDNKYLLNIKVLDGDEPDEPQGLLPVEIDIAIYRLKNNARLVELRALR